MSQELDFVQLQPLTKKNFSEIHIPADALRFPFYLIILSCSSQRLFRMKKTSCALGSSFRVFVQDKRVQLSQDFICTLTWQSPSQPSLSRHTTHFLPPNFCLCEGALRDDTKVAANLTNQYGRRFIIVYQYGHRDDM